MIKNICIVLFLLFATFSFGATEYDKDIIVKDQSRNDKVKIVFREMMNAYQEEDINKFFSYVSEDRFLQDYMTFYEAIEQDIRVYDILSIDTWVEKITDDGVKRFLYVQWDKRYESVESNEEINQKGYSRFLFDEINGNYKLIELAGNNFWGGSLPEWREEVPVISGQEVEVVPRADLVVADVICTNEGLAEIEFEILNEDAEVEFEEIAYKIVDNANNGMELMGSVTDLGIVRLTEVTAINCDEDYDITVIVDPENKIKESNERNNEEQATGYNEPKRPDLLVSDVVCSNEDGTAIQFEIENNGEAEAQGDIGYKIIDNVNGGTQVNGSVTSIGLVEGIDTGDINCDEEYDITVIVDPEDSIIESDETNNETQKTGFNAVSDLVVENVTCSIGDDGADVRFELVNQGKSEIAEDIEYQITDNANGGITLSGVATSLGEIEELGLTAINCEEDYDITVYVDYENKIIESDETNNETQKIGFNSVSKPDLIITDLSCSASNMLTFEIVNDDEGEVIVDRIAYKIIDNTNSDNAIRVGIVVSPEAVSRDVSNDGINCSGSYDITVIVDPSNNIDESDETNNETQRTGNNSPEPIEPPVLPDLIVTNIICSNENGIAIQFEIENNGEAEVQGDIGYKIIDNANGGTQASGSVTSIGLVEGIDTGAISCDENYDITVIVDPEDSIKESDETNNETQKTGFNTVDKPDLIVENVSCSSSSILRFDIVNDDAGEVVGSVDYSIINNRTTSTPITRVDNVGSVSVDISNSISCSNVYDITVTVDQNDKIRESDETNNGTQRKGNNTPYVQPPTDPYTGPTTG